MSSDDWHLHLAIVDAATDTREAPWYGPWDLVLRNFIFEAFSQPPYITITYPQFPVSRDIDTYDPEDDKIHDGEDSDDDGDGNSPTALIRSAAPSPETIRGTPSPKILRRSPNEVLGAHPMFLASHSRRKRSTRIPDFVQLLYRLNINPDGTIDRPVRYSTRIILLVEIKRILEVPTLRSFNDVLPQTDQQARHAFANSPHSQLFGVIIAIGDYWTYVEYDRNHIRTSPSVSEQKDPTYMDTTPAPYESWMRDYEPFTLLAQPTGFLRLQTSLSNQGLLLVRKRLVGLSGME